MEWGSEQQPFPRRTVTGSLSCQTSPSPLSSTWSNFTTSEGSCGQRRKRAADIIVGSTLIIPSLPPAWGCSSHSRGCSLPNCLQCDCLSKVVEGIKTSPYPRERIRVKEKEGKRDERRVGEQKSSRKVAKTLRRNCAKFVGISAEIRQLPPSPTRTEQPHFSKGGGARGRETRAALHSAT